MTDGAVFSRGLTDVACRSLHDECRSLLRSLLTAIFARLLLLFFQARVATTRVTPASERSGEETIRGFRPQGSHTWNRAGCAHYRFSNRTLSCHSLCHKRSQFPPSWCNRKEYVLSLVHATFVIYLEINVRAVHATCLCFGSAFASYIREKENHEAGTLKNQAIYKIESSPKQRQKQVPVAVYQH